MGYSQVEGNQRWTWLTPRLFIFLPLLTHHSADSHGHGLGSHAAHGPEGDIQNVRMQQKNRETIPEKKEMSDEESGDHQPGNISVDDAAVAHIIGVGILEFGVVLHR